MSNRHVARRIGPAVRAARQAARLSRKRLAELADVSERYLNQLEHGEANVSVGLLVKVADALGLEVVQLLRSPVRPTDVAPEAPDAPSPLGALIAGMSRREREGALPVLEHYLAARRKTLAGVALLGLRGAGKSTVGALYAERLGVPFLSVTREIERRAGMRLDDLFNLGGPEAYRALELEVVRELAARRDRIVLEAAGGIVANPEALEVVLGAFRTIWLTASPDEHLQRVIGQGDLRPMQGTPKALDHLKALLGSRAAAYARADLVLDTSGRTPQQCVGEMERLVGDPIGVG